ncbi:hypothetical protein [Rubrivivax gelatinosus]|uniref:hypothetical protein n=1 Tax=Rubrivivax gelatinosus TaxID=28068 RepID=UPI0019068CD1|nr:hypothetical protein [Rubrivivax gelatinosus]
MAWTAGKDAYAGNRLVAEHGPMQAVNLISKTLASHNPNLSTFDAIGMATHLLQYHTMLAQGIMPCHEARKRTKAPSASNNFRFTHIGERNSN